jgi:hypothetical protein
VNGEEAGSVGAPPPPSFTIGGTVANLAGSGLVLKNGAADTLSIAKNGAFTFASSVRQGNGYAVSVFAQPSNPSQICSVANASGTVAGGNVTNVAVTCSTVAYSVGGVVVGVASGVVLTNNGADDLPVGSDRPFTFPTKVPSGMRFAVAIKNAGGPSGGPCDVSGASGTIGGGDVTSVVVNCTPGTYTVGGTVTGLTGTVIVQNSAGNDTKLTANGSFAFSHPLAPTTAYDVTVLTPPDYPPLSQTCVVANGTGAMGTANVTNITITCTTNSFTVGGNVTSLRGPSLVLKNNGGDSLTIIGNGPFAFATSEPSGSSYAVTIGTSPPGEKCTIKNGSGVVTRANITDLDVLCGQDPGIKCGPTLYCSDGEVCCLNGGAGGGTCQPIGTSCGGVSLVCDDAFECPAGGVCCAGYSKGNGSLKDVTCLPSAAACAASPGTSGTEVWCDPNATTPCPNNLACTGASKVSGYMKCQ